MSSHTINFIYAPNIRLFSYHLSNVHLTDFTERHLEIESVISYYQKLLELYQILDQNSQPIDLKLKFREDFQDMLSSGLANFDLILDVKDGGIYRIALPPKYKGFLYPQFLNDTYSFSLTLYHPQKSGNDGISFSDLSQLKPPEDFLFGTYAGVYNLLLCHIILNGQNIELEYFFLLLIAYRLGQIAVNQLSQAFWGSTILLSGFIAQSRPDTADSLKYVADDILKQFLKIQSLEEAPPFFQSGEFLGGYIYEYKSIYRQHRYGQVLILLIFDEATTDKLNDIQWDLPELFLYYHKNRQIFLDSRQEYKASQDEIKKIEETIQKFPRNIPTHVQPDLSDEDIKLLKGEIKNLLDLSLGYSQRIRSLVTFQNTIEINRQNYLDTLTRMEVKSQSDLGIWRDKTDRAFQRFQRQIEVDLVYLQQGERLLDTAINTIRGLVEIDQAERDRHLEHQIQTIGTAIAVGAIVASTSTLIFQEPWTFPWQEHHGDRLHPFIIAVLASLISAGLVWAIFQRKTWCRAVKWIGRIVGGRSGHKNP